MAYGFGLGMPFAAMRGGRFAPSAETTQFFDRLMTPPTQARAILYNNLINSLVTGGVWALLDDLLVFAAADSATSLINLKSSSFQATLDTASGNPTFTADRGWSGNGAPLNRDVNTNFNPSTAGGNYTQNNALLATWILGSTTENNAGIINSASSGAVEIFPKYSGNITYWSVNGSAEINTANAGTPQAFWLAQRTASNASQLFRDDVSQATSANASAALVNEKLVSDTNANITAALAIGASLTSGQRTTLYSVLQTYLTGVGAI